LTIHYAICFLLTNQILRPAVKWNILDINIVDESGGRMAEQNNKNKDLKFVPVTTRRVSEGIFEQIRDKILRGELKPNDRLPSERALIDIFQRSRPTIREALRMLERSGLIETIPGSGGAVIKNVSISTVEQPLESMILLKRITLGDLYEFRIVNESAYIQWAATRRTQDDIDKMRSVLEQAKECKDDWDAFFQCDIDFHLAIVEAGKNKMALIVHQVISQLISDIISAGLMKLSVREREKHRKDIIATHSAMLKAIEDQDVESARRLVSDHLDKFKRFMDTEN
jgi:GntR family transcriptional repressor for pyruvate dehydrogenase complex